MRPTPFRLVLDTNVVVRAMVNARCASGRILASCDRRGVIPVLSRPMLLEYRATLLHPELARRYPELTPEKVKVVLERLAYVGNLVKVGVRFEFSRDPRDAKVIEAAIAGKATHVITADPDLLDLQTGHDDAARRFRRRLPVTEVVEPLAFIERYGGEL